MDALRISLSMDPDDSWRTYRSLHPALWPDIPNDLFVALIDHQLQADPSTFTDRVQTLLVFAQKCGLELDQLGLPLVERILQTALGVHLPEVRRRVRSFRLGLLNELWETIVRRRNGDRHEVPLHLRQAWLEFQLQSSEMTGKRGKDRAQWTKAAVAEAEIFVQQGCGQGVELFLGEILAIEVTDMSPEEWDERIAIMGKGLAQGIDFPRRTIREVLGRARKAYDHHGELDPSRRLSWITSEVGSTVKGPQADRARLILSSINDWLSGQHELDTPAARLERYAEHARSMRSASDISVPRVIRLALGILRHVRVDVTQGPMDKESLDREFQTRILAGTRTTRRSTAQRESQPERTIQNDTQQDVEQTAVSRPAYRGVEGVDPYRALDVVLTMFERVSSRSTADVHVLVAAITRKLLGLLRRDIADQPHDALAPVIERFTRAILVADLIGHIDDHLVYLIFDMLCECIESRTSYILARRMYARVRALEAPYTWSDKRTHHTRWRRLFKAALSQRPHAHFNFASRLYADRYVDIGSIFRQDGLHMVRAIGASGSENPSKYILLERHIKDFVHDDPTRRNGFVLALVKGLTTRRVGRDAWYGFHLALRVLGAKPVPEPVYRMVLNALSSTGRIVDWKRAIAVLDYVPVSHVRLVEYYEGVFRGVLDGPAPSQTRPARMRQETLTALYGHARGRGIRPSAYMIESMARIMAEEGHVGQTTKILHAMVDYDRDVPVDIGQRVLRGLVREELVDDARELEGRLIKLWKRNGTNMDGFVHVRHLRVEWQDEKQVETARTEERGAKLEQVPKIGGLARSLDEAFAKRQGVTGPEVEAPAASEAGPSA